MKKVIFVVAALMAIFSGVAAVSAYEGHEVDVKAHVENALMVSNYNLDYGIVFPQQTLETQLRVGLSQSFRDQTRYSTVAYTMYWESKAIEGNALDPNGDGFFQPIWPYISVAVGSQNFPISGYVDKGNGIIQIGSDNLFLGPDGNECDLIHLILNPPVFDNWYNAATDTLNGHTPSGILTNGAAGTADDQYVVTVETASCGFNAEVPKTDLGSNLKIQVTDIILDVD